jgi:small subunit ribosomal protein S6
MSNRYETLILATPEITNEESSNLESTLSKEIKKAKGSLITYDRWGKFRLAYPVRKNEYGVYFLIRYEIPSESKTAFFEELKSLFAIKFNTIAMRHVTVKLPATAGAVYKRPVSLEETPKDIDVFLRENKMEGLMSNQRSSAPLADENSK